MQIRQPRQVKGDLTCFETNTAGKAEIWCGWDKAHGQMGSDRDGTSMEREHLKLFMRFSWTQITYGTMDKLKCRKRVPRNAQKVKV